MTEKELTLIQELIVASVNKAVPDAVEPAIKKYVNGKIDNLTERLNTHIETHGQDMEELKPIIQGITGAKILGSLLTWMAGIAGAWLVLKGFIIHK